MPDIDPDPLERGWLLLVETATDVFSVALSRGPDVVALQEVRGGRQHGRLIAEASRQLMQHLSLQPAQLAAVAVSSGPGSYTGLRIGAAFAQGLCLAAGLPLLAVPTLQALAWQALPMAQALHAVALVPMLDARRQEVFQAVYSPAGEELTPADALILSENAFEPLLAQGPVVFLGDGAPKWAVQCQHPGAHFLPTQCSAQGLAPLAWQALKRGQLHDPVHYQPFYLKPVSLGPRPVL